MTKSRVAFLAVAAAILSWFSLNANGQRPAEKKSPQQQWEYMIVLKGLGEFQSTEVPSWLSDHGNAGWEMCDVLQHSQSRQFVFKRPK